MYRMKLIYTFFFATLLFCSCKKDYTCTCIDAAHVYPTKEISLSERSQNKAVSTCTDKQTELNVSGSNYNCTLKP